MSDQTTDSTSNSTSTLNNEQIPFAKIGGITSPNAVYIITTIKKIQQRMKNPDLKDLEYIRIYDLLTNEFSYFAEKYTSIFTKVVRGESLAIIAASLFYKDKVEKGLMTESELSDMIAKKYLPAHLKNESDAKLKEMKMNEKI